MLECVNSVTIIKTNHNRERYSFVDAMMIMCYVMFIHTVNQAHWLKRFMLCYFNWFKFLTPVCKLVVQWSFSSTFWWHKSLIHISSDSLNIIPSCCAWFTDQYIIHSDQALKTTKPNQDLREVRNSSTCWSSCSPRLFSALLLLLMYQAAQAWACQVVLTL